MLIQFVKGKGDQDDRNSNEKLLLASKDKPVKSEVELASALGAIATEAARKADHRETPE